MSGPVPKGKMVLAVDVGNTNINCALFKGNRILKKFSLPTKDYSIKKIRKLLGKSKVSSTIICSVVPKISRRIKNDLSRLLHKSPYLLGRDIKAPVKNLYRKPGQVGQDRLANAYAGIRLFNAPLIIIDFGTAITFDLVSKNKEYKGGLILPGLELSLATLTQRAALLPKIKLRDPKELIGRDTKSSMISGIVYGYAGLIEYLVKRLKEKIGKAKVIGTGGHIKLIAKYYKQFDRIDADLTLKGLNLIFRDRDRSPC